MRWPQNIKYSADTYTMIKMWICASWRWDFKYKYKESGALCITLDIWTWCAFLDSAAAPLDIFNILHNSFQNWHTSSFFGSGFILGIGFFGSGFFFGTGFFGRGFLSASSSVDEMIFLGFFLVSSSDEELSDDEEDDVDDNELSDS